MLVLAPASHLLSTAASAEGANDFVDEGIAAGGQRTAEYTKAARR